MFITDGRDFSACPQLTKAVGKALIPCTRASIVTADVRVAAPAPVVTVVLGARVLVVTVLGGVGAVACPRVTRVDRARIPATKQC
jgi:hypothetical protein